MAGTEIEIGSSIDQVGADFAAAWRRAEAGEAVEADRRIGFRDWAALCTVLTPARYDLLRQLKREPGVHARVVARALGRDEVSIVADSDALAELGLVVRGRDGALTAPLDEIVSTIRFAA